MTTTHQNKFNRLSLKAMTINQLQVLIEKVKEIGSPDDFQVLLLTPYGFIKGDLVAFAPQKELFNTISEQPIKMEVDLSSLVSIRGNAVNKLKEENPKLEIVDNGAVLNMKNVEIYKDQIIEPVIKMNQMIVFADQVISFSLIPKDHIQE